MYVYVCVSVSVLVSVCLCLYLCVCVCVCVCETDKKTYRQIQTDRQTDSGTVCKKTPCRTSYAKLMSVNTRTHGLCCCSVCVCVSECLTVCQSVCLFHMCMYVGMCVRVCMYVYLREWEVERPLPLLLHYAVYLHSSVVYKSRPNLDHLDVLCTIWLCTLIKYWVQTPPLPVVFDLPIYRHSSQTRTLPLNHVVFTTFSRRCSEEVEPLCDIDNLGYGTEAPSTILLSGH